MIVLAKNKRHLLGRNDDEITTHSLSSCSLFQWVCVSVPQHSGLLLVDVNAVFCGVVNRDVRCFDVPAEHDDGLNDLPLSARRVQMASIAFMAGMN